MISAAALLLLLVAQPESIVDFELGLSFPAGTNDVGLSIVSPKLHGFFLLGESAALELEWGLVYLDARGAPANAQARAGNPSVAVHTHWPVGPGTAMVGAGVTLPVTSLADEASAFEDALILTTGLAVHGIEDAWLWLPRVAALYIPFRWDAQLGDRSFEVGADTALAVYLPTDGDDPQIGLQAGLRGALRFDALSTGVRIGFAGLPFLEGDLVQTSAALFAAYDFGTVRMNTRLVINIDEPFGFAFDDGKIWGLFVGVALPF